MFEGVLITESLKDGLVPEGFSSFVTYAKISQLDNPAPDQPKVWNMLYFKISEADAQKYAEKFSQLLKSGTWYVDFKSDKEIYVVYPGKIFFYQRGDSKKRTETQAYGRSLGIPEKQLDWSE